MFKKLLVCGATLTMAVALVAQTPPSRALSGRGQASVHVGGEWVKGGRGQTYQGGKWIDVTYGRPVLRQRTNIFGTGAEYGTALNAGAPVWRAGSDQTTRFKTEAALTIGGKPLPAGEYSMFIALAEKEWTLILSNWGAQQKYDKANTAELWGSYGYTPDKDVLRAPMKLETLPFSVDEFTISFIDVTKTGGRLAVMWEKTLASVPFALQ